MANTWFIKGNKGGEDVRASRLLERMTQYRDWKEPKSNDDMPRIYMRRKQEEEERIAREEAAEEARIKAEVEAAEKSSKKGGKKNKAI